MKKNKKRGRSGLQHVNYGESKLFSIDLDKHENKMTLASFL
jgi:hypothetical protein